MHRWRYRYSAGGAAIKDTVDYRAGIWHYAIGDDVSFDGDVAHVFSKETEKNLEW